MLASLLTGYQPRYSFGVSTQGMQPNTEEISEKNDVGSKTDTKKASTTETVNHKPKPPKRNDATISSGEQASRFLLALSQQKPPPPPQGQTPTAPSNMVVEQLQTAGIDTSNFDAKSFDDSIGKAISNLGGDFPDKDTMQSLIMNTL